MNRSAEEAKGDYIKKMGESLGTHFHALWQETASLYLKFNEFVELFGTKPERVDLLNASAPAFFRMAQDALWENMLLHLARLTDPSKSSGTKSNLTIRNLPGLLRDPFAGAALQELVDVAADKTAFCRDWRNRHIAHKDLDLALSGSATPLASASRQQVREALAAIGAVLNAVSGAYTDTETTHFDIVSSLGGAISLLHTLDYGVRAKMARRERLERGEWSAEDLPRDL